MERFIFLFKRKTSKSMSIEDLRGLETELELRADELKADVEEHENVLKETAKDHEELQEKCAAMQENYAAFVAEKLNAEQMEDMVKSNQGKCLETFLKKWQTISWIFMHVASLFPVFPSCL